MADETPKPAPTARPITVALAGNPNSGKTTVFNNLTGAHQHVGNWPGVTVEKKQGTLRHGGCEICVVDLPGTYSLTPYSMEEAIARDFIVEERPDVLVHIVDASNLERSLYLTAQLLELGANVVIALNTMDVASARGDRIDARRLSALLGCLAVPTVARRGEGIEQLKEAMVRAAAEPPARQRHEHFGTDIAEAHIHYGTEVEEHVTDLAALIAADAALSARYPARWLAVALLENDAQAEEKLQAVAGNGEAILKAAEAARAHLENVMSEDVETIMVDARYGYIGGVVKEAVRKGPPDRLTLSDKIDVFVTSRALGIPLFLALMWLTFKLTFGVGAVLADWIDAGVGWLAAWLGGLLGEGLVRSLLVDGVIAGVGGVLVFLPSILIIFFMISLLEDSGYMARAAFIMDRVMHRVGLHGKSFIPLLMGFGCNVPAIMAARTLETRKDRVLTILITPLMSCTARLPIYVLLTAAFFPRGGTWVILSLYLLGVALAIAMGKLFRRFFFAGPEEPFVMELPPYRLPTLKGTAIHMWERASMFLRKAGTIILAGSVVMWFMGAFPWGVEYASAASYAGRLGQVLEPLVRPLGFDWKMAVALTFGVVAKEIVVSTFGVLYGAGSHAGEHDAGLQGAIQGAMTPLTAYGFMVFTLIYVPCLATVAVIKQETGSWKWTAFAVGYSIALAWLAAFVVVWGGRLLGLG